MRRISLAYGHKLVQLDVGLLNNRGERFWLDWSNGVTRGEFFG
jgi:hypothetical protein